MTAPGERKEAASGQCQGCGEIVVIDVPPDGHTRAMPILAPSESEWAGGTELILCGPVDSPSDGREERIPILPPRVPHIVPDTTHETCEAEIARLMELVEGATEALGVKSGSLIDDATLVRADLEAEGNARLAYHAALVAAEAALAQARAALLGLVVRWQPPMLTGPTLPCWCAVDYGVNTHQEQCAAARAALEPPEAR